MTYLHLVGQEKDCASALLERRYKHFLHATTLSALRQIRLGGLDPSFENDRSAYVTHREEPAALRYALPSSAGIKVAKSVATSSCHVWDEAQGIWLAVGQPAMLRVPAHVFLNRSIGLDHSHARTQAEFSALRARGTLPMSSRTFVKLVSKYGIISCYDPIPVADIEVSIGTELTLFSPLSDLQL